MNLASSDAIFLIDNKKVEAHDFYFTLIYITSLSQYLIEYLNFA